MYRKLKPYRIFDGYQMLEPGSVLICRNNGTIEAIVPNSNGLEDVEELPGTLMPGLINTHCHLELSHLAGVIDKHTGLVGFIEQIMSRRAALHEVKAAAMQAAEHAMLQNGIVAVGDISNTTDSIEVKQCSALHYVNFIEISGFVESTANMCFDAGMEVKKQFEQAGLKSFLVPHAPYSVSGRLFQMISALEQPLISIHNQETEAENQLYLYGEGDFYGLYERMGIHINSFQPTGLDSFKSWRPYFNHNSVIAVHNTFIERENILDDGNTWYCLCPAANLYIENKLPPLVMLQNHSSFICLGTDSLASNDRLDILNEIKILSDAFPGTSLHSFLKYATSNGAKALGIFDKYGSFHPGKTPGVLHIDESNLSIINRVF